MLEFFNYVLIIPLVHLTWCLFSEMLNEKKKQRVLAEMFSLIIQMQILAGSHALRWRLFSLPMIFLAKQSTLVLSHVQMVHSFVFLSFISLWLNLSLWMMFFLWFIFLFSFISKFWETLSWLGWGGRFFQGINTILWMFHSVK